MNINLKSNQMKKDKSSNMQELKYTEYKECNQNP